MSNSVVKVTDAMLDDSLLLLVGEDGTVTPDKDTVETFLKSQTGATNIQVMHINNSDDKTIDVAVDNVIYLPDAEGEYVIGQTSPKTSMDEVAQNLYNIKLDHDYTPHYKPIEEIDDLAKTLSILDGTSEPSVSSPIKLIVQPKPPEKIPLPKLISLKPPQALKPVTPIVSKRPKPKPPKVVEPADDNDDEDEDDEEYNIEDEADDDDNDSDFELEDISPKRTKKAVTRHTPKDKLKSLPKTPHKPPPKPFEPPKVEKIVPPPAPSPAAEVKPEKKIIKKEKKPPKPIPDDFALFSTPDIIRRVGGKEPSEPVSPDNKPAKIENRSKSVSESSQGNQKSNRLSLDAKVGDKAPVKVERTREKRPHDGKPRLSTGITSPRKSVEALLSPKLAFVAEPSTDHLEPITSSDALNSLMNVDPKHFPMDVGDLDGSDQNNLALDASGLDLDPSLLDNINNDLISEDILYQVAQSLVSNTELQNAIDKSLNEGNLVLDASLDEVMPSVSHNEKVAQDTIFGSPQKGTQIVRSDGRIVVIPPIERPATRSRNKTKNLNRPSIFKPTHKPLDEEHVSGNELDSSGEEEESEDDPNKLWCICNQPHNNRFMICCDTCEEWYHGKCVNITKAMGQQMESEGREWICLFCKDPMLKRPQAAARRIRRASRNSRQSTDSTGSSKMDSSSGTVPCIVCQKASRSNSIFCSESCILAHAQGVERVVVFERSSGNMLTGNKAPSASNLEQWLMEHPGYEVVRSAGKIVTTKPTPVTQSKLKLIKNPDNEGVSLAIQRKGINVGVLKHLPKNHPQYLSKIPTKGSGPAFKVISRHAPTTDSKVRQTPHTLKSPPTSTPRAKILLPLPRPSNSTTPITKEKPMPIKTPKARLTEQSPPTPLPKQDNIRENVQKTLFQQLTNRLKLDDKLKLSDEALRNISTEIESQLYKCFGDTGQKYRIKYRSLIFNIKDVKNQTLWRRICENSVNPYQLVRLSPDDLASQELASWREREAKHQLDMIKKSELEMLNCNRQYVMKTHKGEQILEEDRPSGNIDNTEVITSLTDDTAEKSPEKLKEVKTVEKKTSSKHTSHKDNRRSKDRSESKDHHHRSASKDHDRNRKRSRSREKTKHADRRRSRSRARDSHRKSSHKSSRYKKEHRPSTEKLDKKSKEILEQLVDNKIVPPLEDRLWTHVPQEDVVLAPLAESDSDHEPSSTVTIPTPPRSNEPDEPPPVEKAKPVEKEQEEESEEAVSPKVTAEEIWRGSINMIDVAQISITAHEISGDCLGLGMDLPSSLDIVGRISPDTVWDYISKMKCSNSKTISVVRLNAVNIEEKMPYLALYSYLSNRNRLGVVKSTNKAFKDFYIWPLASQKPMPPALLPIHGPGLPEKRPSLLLGIIVRDKRKRPMTDSATPAHSVKKTKVEVAIVSKPSRSYTPPPVKEAKPKLPLPPPVADQDDADEPYSPEDSDTDMPAASAEAPPTAKPAEDSATKTFQPFANKFDDIIPGLDAPGLPSSTQEIERQMEKLNKEIEMQKSEINSISQNIATASTEIGTSALASIALPSNLQQILDSIKTIGAVSNSDAPELTPTASTSVEDGSDLTIPLMLPTTFSRNVSSSMDTSDNTIPLNLPKKKGEGDSKTASVLSSLSEEDLIRKAEEMLGQSDSSKRYSGSTSKGTKIDLTQSPVNRLDNK